MSEQGSGLDLSGVPLRSSRPSRTPAPTPTNRSLSSGPTLPRVQGWNPGQTMSGPKPEPTTTAGSLARGADNMQATWYATGQVFSQALSDTFDSPDMEGMSEYFGENAERNLLEAAQNPASIPTWEDATDWEKKFTWFAEAVFENVPNMATTFATGGVFAALSKTGALAGAGKQLFSKMPLKAAQKFQSAIPAIEQKVGSTTGAFAKGMIAGTYPQVTGETQLEFNERGIRAPATVIASGIPQTVVEFATGIEAKMMKAITSVGVPKKVFDNVFARLTASGALTAIGEGTEEAIQQTMQYVAVAMHDPSFDWDDPEAIENIKESARKGAAAGAGTTVAMDVTHEALTLGQGTFQKLNAKKNPVNPDDPDDIIGLHAPIDPSEGPIDASPEIFKKDIDAMFTNQLEVMALANNWTKRQENGAPLFGGKPEDQMTGAQVLERFNKVLSGNQRVDADVAVGIMAGMENLRSPVEGVEIPGNSISGSIARGYSDAADIIIGALGRGKAGEQTLTEEMLAAQGDTVSDTNEQESDKVSDQVQRSVARGIAKTINLAAIRRRIAGENASDNPAAIREAVIEAIGSPRAARAVKKNTALALEARAAEMVFDVAAAKMAFDRAKREGTADAETLMAEYADKLKKQQMYADLTKVAPIPAGRELPETTRRADSQIESVVKGEKKAAVFTPGTTPSSEVVSGLPDNVESGWIAGNQWFSSDEEYTAMLKATDGNNPTEVQETIKTVLDKPAVKSATDNRAVVIRDAENNVMSETTFHSSEEELFWRSAQSHVPNGGTVEVTSIEQAVQVKQEELAQQEVEQSADGPPAANDFLEDGELPRAKRPQSITDQIEALKNRVAQEQNAPTNTSLEEQAGVTPELAQALRAANVTNKQDLADMSVFEMMDVAEDNPNIPMTVGLAGNIIMAARRTAAEQTALRNALVEAGVNRIDSGQVPDTLQLDAMYEAVASREIGIVQEFGPEQTRNMIADMVEHAIETKQPFRLKTFFSQPVADMGMEQAVFSSPLSDEVTEVTEEDINTTEETQWTMFESYGVEKPADYGVNVSDNAALSTHNRSDEATLEILAGQDRNNKRKLKNAWNYPGFRIFGHKTDGADNVVGWKQRDKNTGKGIEKKMRTLQENDHINQYSIVFSPTKGVYYIKQWLPLAGIPTDVSIRPDYASDALYESQVIDRILEPELQYSYFPLDKNGKTIKDVEKSKAEKKFVPVSVKATDVTESLNPGTLFKAEQEAIALSPIGKIKTEENPVQGQYFRSDQGEFGTDHTTKMQFRALGFRRIERDGSYKQAKQKDAKGKVVLDGNGQYVWEDELQYYRMDRVLRVYEKVVDANYANAPTMGRVEKYDLAMAHALADFYGRGYVAQVQEGGTQFSKLPSYKVGQRSMTYAGIGTSEEKGVKIPPKVKAAITKAAEALSKRGYTLLSGNATGADQAFEKGAGKNKRIFKADQATKQTRTIAQEIHPNPGALSGYALNLMARNTNQVFGADLNQPVDFVLVWTEDGAETAADRQYKTGGSGQAIEMAARKGIPVINMANTGWQARLVEVLDGNYVPMTDGTPQSDVALRAEQRSQETGFPVNPFTDDRSGTRGDEGFALPDDLTVASVAGKVRVMGKDLNSMRARLSNNLVELGNVQRRLYQLREEGQQVNAVLMHPNDSNIVDDWLSLYMTDEQLQASARRHKGYDEVALTEEEAANFWQFEDKRRDLLIEAAESRRADIFGEDGQENGELHELLAKRQQLMSKVKQHDFSMQPEFGENYRGDEDTDEQFIRHDVIQDHFDQAESRSTDTLSYDEREYAESKNDPGLHGAARTLRTAHASTVVKQFWQTYGDFEGTEKNLLAGAIKATGIKANVVMVSLGTTPDLSVVAGSSDYAKAVADMEADPTIPAKLVGANDTAIIIVRPATTPAMKQARLIHIGHELGHLVLRTYSQSIEANPTLKAQIFAGKPAKADAHEWFADKFAGWLFAQVGTRGRNNQRVADVTPEAETAFRAVRNILQSVWSAVKRILPKRFARNYAFETAFINPLVAKMRAPILRDDIAKLQRTDTMRQLEEQLSEVQLLRSEGPERGSDSQVAFLKRMRPDLKTLPPYGQRDALLEEIEMALVTQVNAERIESHKRYSEEKPLKHAELMALEQELRPEIQAFNARAELGIFTDNLTIPTLAQNNTVLRAGIKAASTVERVIAPVWKTGNQMLRSKALNADDIANMFFSPSQSRSAQQFGDGVLNRQFPEMERWASLFNAGLPKDVTRRNEVIDWAQKELPIEQAPEEYRAELVEFRKVSNQFRDYLNKNMGGTIGLIPNHFPRSHSLKEISERGERWKSIIIAAAAASGMEITPTVAERLRQEILTDDGVTEYSQAISPTGFYSRQSRGLDIPNLSVALQQAGFLADPEASLQAYITSGTKRALWEQKFGEHRPWQEVYDAAIKNSESNDYVESLRQMRIWHDEQAAEGEDLQLWDASSKLNRAIAAHPDENQPRIKKIVEGYQGRLGLDISPEWQKAQSYMMALQFTNLLAFSTLASLPDFGNIMIRSKSLFDPLAAWSRTGSWAEASEKAHLLGIIGDRMESQSLIMSDGHRFIEPNVQKGIDAFFKYTGLMAFTKMTRIAAMTAGEHFLETHAQKALAGNEESAGFLAELNVTAQQVQHWVANEKPYAPTATDTQFTPVHHALQKFVDEAILRPNAGVRPTWANDHRLALVWQLKSFFYAFGSIVVGGIWRDIQSRQGARKAIPPLIAAVALMPLAALGLMLRNSVKAGIYALQGDDDWEPETERMNQGQYMIELIDRTGAPGIFSIGKNMLSASDYGSSPLVAAMGPTAQWFEMWLDPDTTLTEAAVRGLPFQQLIAQ